MHLLLLAEGVAIVRYEDAVFLGQVQAGRRQGLGILVSVAGECYEGAWQDDRRHGHGLETCPEGQYCGEFVLGRREGWGVMHYPDGSVYEGDWVAGRPKGFCGCHRTPEGLTYKGQWDGCAEGMGRLTNSQGDVYEGNFRGGLKEGFGREAFASGVMYHGYYRENQYEGEGILRELNFEYEGEFRGGLMEGKGVQHCRDHTYTGGSLNRPVPSWKEAGLGRHRLGGRGSLHRPIR